MMISSAGAPDPYAAAALDRQLRAASDAAGDDGSAGTTLDAGPDVVVTLSGGAAPAPSTYDASGRLAGTPTLADLGANAPDSSAQATESQDDGSSDATAPAAGATATAPSDDAGTDDASVDEDSAVPA